ncbi:family 1 glycosyltransferase [Cryphonectria parasitica EP155]|uniref:Sterol 3-beta-glucosyltransferase n=1 Tax=Cryphonectria parasitica (strain ATCC 38755 / EP155) TaxID=660469 RepID=A0A9P4Y021_CRYP1|nr:family 1 glycosyltransferase [Cryphonectria parasitica EP155]KAF3764048.1 family 1 glycosyltransferase [Cryphonectria parasitica EP155]
MEPQQQPQSPTSAPPQPSASSQPEPRRSTHRQQRGPVLSISSQPSLPQSPTITLSPISPSPSDPRRRTLHRKLQKRHPPHSHTMDFPDQLRRKEEDDEQEEDVLPVGLGGNRPFVNLNQSIFGLIAAAGPKVDFHNRFEGHSSEEEDADDSRDDESGREEHTRHDALANPMSQTTVLTKPGSKSRRSHRRRFSGDKLMRSVPLLSRLSSKSRSKKDEKKPVTQIQEESEPESAVDEALVLSSTHDGNRLAPVMSRMLEARAEVAARPSSDLERGSMDVRPATPDLTGTGPTELSKRLQGIFELDEPEELIAEYPCWLLQGVLLQGYIYITSKHICFYAYLPKKAHEVTKSGHLSKSGKRNPKYNRYWFRLKGDVFSYYRDSSNLYFPHGQIDLRYGISASVTDKDKDGVNFTLETDHRTYYFRADSAQSAKEWVKCLQRVIFRSHNDGDSVKISLPIQNVIDIEETQMLEFAETCKIRVIDNDETYAIDEYFFSFFSLGQEAIGVLKILIEDAAVTPSDSKGDSKRSSYIGNRPGLSAPAEIRTGKLRDNVRATLSPHSPRSPTGPSPRGSGEYPRSSFDAIRQFTRRSTDIPRGDASPRRSFSRDRERSLSRQRRSGKRLESADSYAESTEDPSIVSFSAMTTSGELDQSASQILRGSDVFHSPTVQRSSSAKGREHQPRSPKHHLSAGNLDQFQPHHAATTGHVPDPASGEKFEGPAATLETITKIGTYPLQRVGAFAEYLTRHSKKMSGMLATESMGYAGKVSGMWKGGQKHYDEHAALKTGEEPDDEEQDRIAEDRFQIHFALPRSERLRATYFGYFMRVLPLYGKVYLSDRTLCFRSLMPGTRTKLILPIRDIENVTKSSGFRLGYAGLVVVIRGHEELFFEFGDSALRDDLTAFLHKGIEASKFLRDSGELDVEAREEAEKAVAEQKALEEARHDEFPEHELTLPRHASTGSDGPTIIFDDPKASFVNFKPEKALRVTCLTIGSRGDVQPYIALCKGLLAEGHKPKIATHLEFKGWIEKHGIEFAPVEGDPGELMRLCIENGTFTVSFLQKANSTMRSWLDGLLSSSWLACRGSDVLIESPSAMGGIHIAEKLCIPYFRAFGMPWTRTRAYPHAFMMPERKMGGAYNLITYVLFDAVFWKATAHQINKWRNKTLGLPSTSLEKLQPNKVPFIYNFSPQVVPPPMDYSDWIRVTGYWFLDEGGKDWTPPADLVAFIDKARKDGKKLVYIGFGSIILDNPAKFTREIIDAVVKADVRCILSKGWSDRLDPKAEGAASGEQSGHTTSDGNPTAHGTTEIPLPPEILAIKSAPHDWLFNQIDAAAHHGGSGTTGASLRAGIPTIIRPFFGDQFFFGGRVEDLGVGILLKKWGVNSFARALWEATHSERMIVKARVLGENIRKENGVDTAIQCIYRDMEYAKSLIEKKAGKNAAAAGHTSNYGSDTVDDDAEEESWTFVGEDGPDEDEDVDIDIALQRSSFFTSGSEAASPPSAHQRAAVPSNSVLWTTAGTTAPAGQRSPLRQASSSGSGSRRRKDKVSPKDTRDHAEKRGR